MFKCKDTLELREVACWICARLTVAKAWSVQVEERQFSESSWERTSMPWSCRDLRCRKQPALRGMGCPCQPDMVVVYLSINLTIISRVPVNMLNIALDTKDIMGERKDISTFSELAFKDEDTVTGKYMEHTHEHYIFLRW